MSIYLGSNKIKDLYFGSQKIGSIYLGGQKVYSAGGSIPSVKIGNQIWMSQNLAIDDGQGGIYTQTVNYGQGDVVEYYYNWDAAVRVAATVEGWRLPTYSDFGVIYTAYGNTAGTKLKSTYGWTSGNGTDELGFSAFPAGYRWGSSFLNTGSEFRMWTSDTQGRDEAYYNLLNTRAYIDGSTDYKFKCLSVRLIKAT